ncbi:hypothetical protein LMG7141_00840 [Ralstonia condita]|uniref:Uncharacterized protein n=1 Tax=Ralstonia condita TaxID=3058600 RepID=A0ABN9IDH2_9RALS|nr:hypothetical protein [Ralstonia sp. LMG 7141]CAJ0779106.1 hypothetical protein LMG7141_00840 [Ralstonia sp. LMG 7141]
MSTNEIIAKHFADDPANAVRAHAAVQEILRAQADARPVLWWNGIRKGEAGDFVGPSFSEKEDTNHDIPLVSAVNPCNYTHPEASAPGLSVEDAMRIVMANWGDKAAIEKAFAANLARASAATVAEPIPISDAKLKQFGETMRKEGYAQGWHDRAAQQQAEPGADERAAQSVNDLPRVANSLGGFRGGFIGVHGRAPTEQEIWNGGVRSGMDRAAQSGQRAGVADGKAPLPLEVLDVLRFYANGHHFSLSDDTAWDTVSGEPQNFWCDEAGTATVEDGSVAKALLQGKPYGDGEPCAPIVGEVFTALASAPTQQQEGE